MTDELKAEREDYCKCPGCNGSGTVTERTYDLGPDDFEIDISCPSCGGTGELDRTYTTGGDKYGRD